MKICVERGPGRIIETIHKDDDQDPKIVFELFSRQIGQRKNAACGRKRLHNDQGPRVRPELVERGKKNEDGADMVAQKADIFLERREKKITLQGIPHRLSEDPEIECAGLECRLPFKADNAHNGRIKNKKASR